MKRNRTGNPKIAIAYIRVSKNTQRLGPEAQRAMIEQWAEREGVTVAAWHEDRGLCGASDLGDRPGLTGAMTALTTHRAGVLVVAKRDRLGRDVGVTAMIELAVTRLGAAVVATSGEGAGSSPTEALISRTMADLFSSIERTRIIERTRAALAVKRAKGERIGAIPFGMTLAADDSHRLVEGERACPSTCTGCLHLTPNPDEQTTIERCRHLHGEGLSVRAVASQLATEGIVGRTGQPLSHTQVHRIVRAA